MGFRQDKAHRVNQQRIGTSHVIQYGRLFEFAISVNQFGQGGIQCAT